MVRLQGGLAVALLLAAGGCMKKSNSRPREAWDPISNRPETIHAEEEALEYDFFALPTQGALEEKPWSEDYWPSYQGGIARRWYGVRMSAEEQHKYVPPTLEALRGMTIEQKKSLSPAEKYSIFVGDYDYRLVAEERRRVTLSPGPNGSMVTRPELPWKIPTWEGLCHAWTPASVFFHEPGPVELSNADGIVVPFGASDVKALLIIMTHEDAGTPGNAGTPENAIFPRVVGGQCLAPLGADGTTEDRPECRDTNPGAFHVVLANRLGVRRAPLFADLMNGDQIWNHPIFEYKTTVFSARAPSASASTKAVREVVVSTQLRVATEVHPQWVKTGTTEKDPDQMTFLYSLELDGRGHIVGGEWLSHAAGRHEYLRVAQNKYLDNLWLRGKPRFSWSTQPEKWKPLERIYNAATTGR